MNAPDHPSDPQPFERMNYFNGQRLTASDFRSEQDYQMRVRRSLNRALYSPGVVTGMEVEAHPADTHRVIVQPGLAFDFLGREVILLEPREVTVSGSPSTTPGIAFGNYLAISYAEERAQPVSDGCRIALRPAPCSGDLAWGAPTRIRADPRLQMLDAWPVDESGKIVLAQIELGPNCEVRTINQGVRKYAMPAKPPTVRPISLEGEKDLDASNPKILHFHIEGGYPSAVTLHLRAARFSTLYYSQIGRHAHELDLVLDEVAGLEEHQHTLEELQTDEAPAHSHVIRANVDDADNALETAGAEDFVNLSDRVRMEVSSEGAHSHRIEGGATTDSAPGLPPHSHAFIASQAVPFGAQPPASPGPALTYFTDLQIAFDGADITLAVLQQLSGRDPANWNGQTLGDGTQHHVLVQTGTGPIELHRLVNDLGPGPHMLELRVGAGGGKIHYNLYVD